MNDRAPQYFLWHPRYEGSGTSMTCLVDVAPADDVLIDRGHAKLVDHFAAQLGLGGSEIAEWTLKPFTTPYYAYDINSDDLKTMLSPAWRLRLDVTRSTSDSIEVPMSPIPAWGYDPTWWEHRRPWDWNAHETVVIALNGPDPDLDFLDDIHQPIDVETIMFPGRRFEVSQVRISLGRIPIPDDVDKIFRVVDACYQRALIVHCQAADGVFIQ